MTITGGDNVTLQKNFTAQFALKADLVGGLVPANQLPSYVDDVIEVANYAALPVTGETGKIYVAIDTGFTYRWSGTVYVQFPNLQLGETSTTAYRGDRGKIAYDHSQLITGNPHVVTQTEVGLGSVDNTSDANKPVSTAQATAIGLKIDTSTLDTDGTLAANSDAKIATQKATKTYVDNTIATGTPDATTILKGKVKLAGDLAGTADLPTVPELANKANIASPTFTGTVGGITSTMVGLGSVDNTSDVNKPVSTAQATADTNTLNTAKSYADGLVVGLWDDRGSFNASVNTYPTTGGSGTAGAILKGDIWTISVVATSGVLLGYVVGTSVRAIVDTPGQTVSNWAATEVGIGYVSENVANKDTDGTLAANSDTKYASQKATKTYADTKVSKSGDETVAGIKTFSSSPLVPTPTTASQATTKAYVDGVDAGKVNNTGNETIAGVKTFSSITKSVNYINSFTTTDTATATTTLTVNSTYQQFFTGTLTQTILLPVVSTLDIGHSFYIKNLSSGTITIQSSGGNAITTLSTGQSNVFISILNTGTTDTSWTYTPSGSYVDLSTNQSVGGVKTFSSAPITAGVKMGSATDNPVLKVLYMTTTSPSAAGGSAGRVSYPTATPSIGTIIGITGLLNVNGGSVWEPLNDAYDNVSSGYIGFYADSVGISTNAGASAPAGVLSKTCRFTIFYT